MSKLTDLTEKVEGLRTEMLDLETVEEPTEDQLSRMAALPAEFDSAKADFDTENARVAKLEEVRSLSLTPANREEGFSAPSVIVRKDPFEHVERVANMDANAARSLALQAFGDDVKLRGITDAQHEALVERIEQDGRVKEMRGTAAHILVHGSPAYRSAFQAFFDAGTRGQTPVYSTEEALAVRASLALGGSTGGYTLPTLLDPTLIHTGTAAKNPMRSVSRIVEGNQQTWHGVSVGNVTTAWAAEAAALSDGSPTFSNPSVTAGALTAYVTASYEIFEDSDLQAQLPGLIGEAFSFAEQTAFITGSGTNGPTGIVTAISATAASTVTCTTRGSFTSASAVDVFALLGAVPSRYEDTSTWVANKSWFNTVRQMSTASQGSYFWTNFNSDTVGQGGQQNMLGSPTLQASDMNTSFASGSVIAILGDFSQFVIYDRLGTTVEFVQNVFNSSAAPLRQRGLIAHKRVGSNCTDINAFRFLKA